MASISEIISQVKERQLQRVLEAMFKDLVVSAPAAITSTAAAGANPTKAEFDALRNDVVALRNTVVSLASTKA